MTTTILYVPGLGDGYDRFRRWMLRGWSLFGVKVELVPITWYDGADFDAKYRLLTEAIGHVRTERAVLIGESAGATLALHAAADSRLRLDKVITLCGVAHRSTPISPRLRRRAPALSEAVDDLPSHYQVPVVSIRAAVDHVVGRRYSTADGAEPHVIWTVGHLMTIVVCLTLLAPYMILLARRP